MGGSLDPVAPSVPPQWKDATGAPTQTSRAAAPSDSAAAVQDPSALAMAAPATSTNKVALRALVVAMSPDDYGLPTWTSMLDKVGAAYDVVLADRQAITADLLVDAAGAGRYNAILLTNALMLLAQPDGTYTQVVDATEWSTLWAYERDYAVRQATLYASYGSWPENYCMTAGSEGGVGDTPVLASLTSAGSAVFDELSPATQIPVTQSYVYRNTVDTSCATPVLTSGTNTLGVTSVADDGRERIALSFSNNQYLLQSTLLAYGMFRWASRGLFLGQRTHSLKLDVDDYFNGADIIQPDRSIASDAYLMTGSEALNVRTRQNALRAEHPQAAQFRLTLAYNGGDVVRPKSCTPRGGGVSALPSSTKCFVSEMEWVNHTFTHPKMNFTTATQSTSEIANNLQFASRFTFTVDRTILKTGEYSGLGVYNPDPNDDVGPPTDYGLMASNPNLIAAAASQGVKYLHGNMSFTSHQPACFNCNIVHPMNSAISVVPDWPTNIAYFSSTPAQEETFYNWYYGPGGLFPYFSQPQTYAQILDHESSVALEHVASGSLYTHTMHIANLHNYGGGRTLAFDWLDATMDKYDAYFAVPLLSPTWGQLATQTTDRNSHFAIRDATTAIYDPVAGTVTVTSSSSGRLQLTGVLAPGATNYGTSAQVTASVTAGTAMTWPAAVRP